jgi:inner membrane protein
MVDAGVVVGVLLLTLGIVFLVAEIIHPGAFLLIPGTAFAVAGALYIVVPSLITQSIFGPAIIAIATALVTIGSFPYYKHIAPVHRPMTSMPMSFEGMTGIVIATVQPDNLRGKVRINSEIWSARADRMIPEGTRVRILGGEGVAVRVVPLDERPAA